MRRCIPYLLALASAAAAPAGAVSRDEAFARLRDEARVAKLEEQSADDVKNHRYEVALKKAIEADALRPGNPIILNTKGAALTELGRYDEATKALEAAVAADPQAFQPQFNQGEMLSLQKKYSDAAVQFTVLLSRFGAIPIIKYKIYLCYVLTGQKNLASDALRTMRYPEDGAAWYFAHAVDRLQAGQRSEALRLLAAADAIHHEEAQTYRDTLRGTGLLK
ncbi:MAG: tetratricopeptide repeat protein [Terrimicrobiaceae bacterium]|nr:tetratricopeptide repeat protein [Terrimicrobiaceae bacterium]